MNTIKKAFLETFHISELSIVVLSSCGFVSGLSIHFWPALRDTLLCFPLWFKEHKQQLSYGHTDTLMDLWNP